MLILKLVSGTLMATNKIIANRKYKSTGVGEDCATK